MEEMILVIDDNKDILENAAEILQLAGYRTMTAGNGRIGIELALKEKPSLIVCDIMMPELDGYAVLHLLRKNPATRDTPFIFLTAKTERTDLRKGMEMGADDYITKPFDDIELLNAVEVRLKKMKLFSKDYASSKDGLSAFIKDVNENAIAGNLSADYPVEMYNKKELLYTEGSTPHYLYYIVSGKLKSFKISEDGKEYITGLYIEADFAGYTALLEDRSYDDNVSVMEPASVMKIPKEDFISMLYSDISIAAKFIRIISKNIKEKEDRLLSLAYDSLRKRVAAALLDISDKFNSGKDNTALLISREDIARYTGTATESIIRTLSDFKAEELIDIKNGKILIRSQDKLKRLLY